MVFDVIIGRNRKDVEKYGKEGTVLIGKQYVKMGQTTSLSNPVYLDVAGAHVVFIVGKRGSGKCVAPQTMVKTNDIFMPIEDLFQTVPKSPIEITDDEEYFRVIQPFYVASLTEDLRIVSALVSHLYRKKIQEDLLKITTQYGSSILITKEHPLLQHYQVPGSSSFQVQFQWLAASQLKVGDTIVGYEEAVRPEIIKNIEKVDYDGWVYDVTIPGTHNFVGNNIVCHNSYTMGSMAEGLADLPLEIKQNLSLLLLDTMGIYWTMKFPNFQDSELVKQWGFEPKGLDVKIYTPSGFYRQYQEQGIPTDFPFSIRPIDVNPEDWCNVFSLDQNSKEGVLITKITQQLKEAQESYDLDELVAIIRNDQESDHTTISVVVNEFLKAKGWQIFSKEGTPLKDIVSAGQITVLDVSPYATMASGWDIKALVVGLISRTLFNQRMLTRKTEEFKTVDAAMHYFSKDNEGKLSEPLVWLALDEAHELLPREGKTAATNALITLLREGRQPGISLILATQQPAKINSDVMTLADIVLGHRLTARMDVQALQMLTQSYMQTGLEEEMDHLPRVKGAAVIFDDANERIFPVQMRPRFTWHGGGSPFAIPEKKEFFKDNMKKLQDL